MRRDLSFGAMAVFATARVLAAGADPASSSDDKLNDYLVDITAGQVTASNLLGLDKSAVTDVQTSQDLIAALMPFSSNDEKGGFGLAITPARTALFGMSGNTYASGIPARLLGKLTVSYAQNTANLNSVDYKKYAASIDTVFYLNKAEDPVMIASAAFANCQALTATESAAALNDIALNPNLTPEQRTVLLADLAKKRDPLQRACIDAALATAKWNSSRISFGYGQGRISPPSGRAFSFGKYVTINALIGTGARAAVNVSLRRSVDVLDLDRFDPANPHYSSASLAAIRYTYGDQDGSNLRGLVEISNANSGTTNAAKDVFIYAIGIDKKIAKGIWLSFRLGRNHTLDGDRQQTTGLLNLSLQPSLTAFAQ